MKYIKLYETWGKSYWSINFQDPYMLHKAYKILNKSNDFDKKIASIINYRDNHPDEERVLYITNWGYRWNIFDDSEFKEDGLIYSGGVELTEEEKEMADMEITAKKYNV